MKLQFKNNFFGYFKFYYNVVGFKLVINLMLCILVSFLDGIGLAMFMPLLQMVGDAEVNSDSVAMGNLRFITDSMEAIGLSLNLTSVLIFLILFFFLKGIMKFIQGYYLVKLRHLFMSTVRNSLVSDLNNLSYKGFLKLDAGKIQNTLITEVQRLFQTMNHYFNATQSGVMILTYVVLAFVANYQFAILVAIGAGLSNFLYKRIYFLTKKASIAFSKSGNDFNSYLIQAINYFKYLKSTNYFSKYSIKLRQVIRESEMLNSKMGFYSAISLSIREPIIVIIVSLVIYIQVSIMGGSLTSIILSLLLFYRALSQLMVLQSFWQNFIQNIGSMYSISEISAEMQELKEPEGSVDFERINNGILFKDVEFSYGDYKVLNGVNISIAKNKTIALVGQSGSGKTTLANMVAGLVLPKKGELLIDGIRIDKYRLNTFRDKVGYISQEPVIFNDNIYNNVTFWDETNEENLSRFRKVVELASLSEFIDSQPNKEFTILGDNGILISGGQKQRISIARELYKDAEILILDEATSALDSETERMIQENIESLHGKYTILIIAHRLSTIKNADVIYLIDKGRVEHSGDFNTLLQKSDKFKRMVALQEFQ